MEEIIKKEKISLLLSVKEMVEKQRPIFTSPWSNNHLSGYHRALSDIQSLLDEEINKVKDN